MTGAIVTFKKVIGKDIFCRGLHGGAVVEGPGQIPAEFFLSGVCMFASWTVQGGASPFTALFQNIKDLVSSNATNCN